MAFWATTNKRQRLVKFIILLSLDIEIRNQNNSENRERHVIGPLREQLTAIYLVKNLCACGDIRDAKTWFTVLSPSVPDKGPTVLSPSVPVKNTIVLSLSVPVKNPTVLSPSAPVKSPMSCPLQPESKAPPPCPFLPQSKTPLSCPLQPQSKFQCPVPFSQSQKPHCPVHFSPSQNTNFLSTSAPVKSPNSHFTEGCLDLGASWTVH